MNCKNKILILLLFFSIVHVKAQIEHLDTQKDLNSALSGEQEVRAEERIGLHPGFKYKAESGSKFRAFIDKLNLKPNPYARNELGGGNNGIVGDLGGSVDVSPQMGQLSYSIALSIPAGTGGMQPLLGINYSSSAQDGLLGYGFELSGLSVINRNPEKGKGISFNDKRFMLDGEPLVELSTTSDGNREYRLKRDNFSKIIALGDDPTNPHTFMVYTKDGLIYEYRSNDSNLITKSTSTKKSLFWFLVKVTDTKGNYFTISYDRDDANNEYWPIRMDYTGNEEADLSPYASVQFSYLQDTDPLFYYISDRRVQKSKILKEIGIYYGNKKLKAYSFNYHNKSKDKPSYLLESITEETADGLNKNPTRFKWEDLDYRFGGGSWIASKYLSGGMVPSDLRVATFGNFSGKGKSEFACYKIWSNNKGIEIVGTEVGVGPNPTRTLYGLNDFKGVYAVDLNGDGYDDIIVHRSNNTIDHYLNISKENSEESLKFEFQNSMKYAHPTNAFSLEKILIADFDADGKSDYLVHDNKKYFTTSIGGGFSEFKNPPKDIVIMDLNGDGSSKMVCFYDNGYDIYGFDHNGAHFEKSVTDYPVLTSKNSAKHYVGDFNGDGKSDILTRYKPEGSSIYKIMLSYGKGSGFVTENITIKTEQYNENVFDNNLNKDEFQIFVGDINGDGMSDFFVVKNNDSGYADLHPFINSGAFFYQGIQGKDRVPKASNVNYSIVDIDGRGLASLYGVNGNSLLGSYYRFLYGQDSFHKTLTSIEDGLGNLTKVKYKRANDPSVHTQGTTQATTSSKVRSFNSPMKVVSEIQRSNGMGGFNSVTYHYSDLLINPGDRLLGFRGATIIDGATNFIEEYNYQLYTVYQPELLLASQAIKENTSQENLLKRVDNEYSKHRTAVGISGEQCYYVRMSKTNEAKYDYGSNNSKVAISDVTTVYEDDLTELHGNTTLVTVIKKLGSSKIITETTNRYADSKEKWHLGRLIESSTGIREDVRPEDQRFSYYIKKSFFTYDEASGLLSSERFEVTESGIEQLHLGYQKTYEHDEFGNILKSTTTPKESQYAPRSTSSTYDEKGRFLKQATNELGFTTTYKMNDELGVLLSSVDENGIETKFTYNSFGQKLMTIHPLSHSQSVTRWSKGHEDAPQNAMYFTFSEESGGAPVLEFYSSIGRLLRKVTIGFGGKKIYSDIQYHGNGQVESSSEPYFPGDQILWTKNQYDLRGHLISEIFYDEYGAQRTMLYIYSPFTVKTIDPGSVSNTKVVNMLGQLVEAIDNIGGTVKYEYDLDGNCIKTKGARTTIATEFDAAGNRTKLIDPDLGTINYKYNVYGELVRSEDERGVTQYTYDKLGRVLKVVAPDYTLTNTYDKDFKGALSSVSKTVGQTAIVETFEYDKYGRSIQSTQTLEGKSYVAQTSYDSYSRPNIITYPSGFKVQNKYTEHGYLDRVINLTDNKTVWQANLTNARGQLEQIALGNGLITNRTYSSDGSLRTDKTDGINSNFYVFHSNGNLSSRQDLLRGREENFVYDRLNRLSGVYQFKSNSITAYVEQIGYDGAGNITSKKQTHYRDYQNNIVDKERDFGTFEYFDGTNRLKSISGGDYTPPDWDEIRYTSFNKISYVLQGTSSLNLIYGVDNQRIKSVTKHNGKEKIKYFLAGGSYEEEVVNGVVKKIHYISAGSGTVAIVEELDSKRSTLYLHKDHLGSAIAFSDDLGKLAQELSYDAWGARRDPETWELYDNLADAKALNERGFTGHEHLDIFEMINMNGRMYDPMIGRFLTPDPFVQAPDYTQGLNRYIYCLNNPLSLTDPSGYSWIGRNWKSLFSAAVGVAVGFATGGAGLGLAPVLSGMLSGMSSAIAGALLNGANFQQAMFSTLQGAAFGAFSAGISFEIGELKLSNVFAKMALHGASQAGLEGLRGGNMLHSFMAAAASSAGASGMARFGGQIGSAGRVIANAVIGGTASELGGGKFANGAITAAFIQLYNENAHMRKNVFRPKYEDLEAAYPSDGVEDYDAPTIYTIAGLENLYNSDPEVYANACAVRVSIALNDAGVEIPHIKGTVKGVDGKFYFLSAEQLDNWMTKHFGAPDIKTGDISKMEGNRGIYIMRPASPVIFKATGHGTLYNGTRTIGNDYSDRKGAVLKLWKF